MRLDESDRQRLARAFAATLPTWADREAVASRAGLTDVQLTGEPEPAWRLLVDEAAERGRVVNLARAAARHRSGDATLATIAAGLENGVVVTPSDSAPRLAAVAGGFVVLVVVWFAVTTNQSTTMPPPQAAPTLQAETRKAARPAPAPSTPIPEVVPSSPPEVVPPEETPPPEPVEAEADDAADVSALDGFGETEACKGVEGYLYMGKTISVKKGDVWRAPKWLNVRADHPRFENQWKMSPEIRCVLPEGYAVRLVEAPIPVAGGAYWVHVKGEWVAEAPP
jgi:hypothetical protein